MSKWHPSRRSFLSQTGTILVGGAGVGSVAADSPEGPFLTKLKTVTFGGYLNFTDVPPGGDSDAIHLGNFTIPDLQTTSHTLKTVAASGLSVYPTSNRGVEIEVPEADPDAYDGEILGYRLVGDLRWGPQATETSPTADMLGYELFAYDPDIGWSGIATSDGSFEDGQRLFFWKYPRLKGLAWAVPGIKYLFRPYSRRGGARWELDLRAEVIVDTPRPRLGNANGFKEADSATFATHKATSMADIEGYTIITTPRSEGVSSEAQITPDIYRDPYYASRTGQENLYLGPNIFKPSPWRAGAAERFRADCGLRLESELEYSNCFVNGFRYWVTPEGGVTEWDVKTDIYKRVRP